MVSLFLGLAYFQSLQQMQGSISKWILFAKVSLSPSVLALYNFWVIKYPSTHVQPRKVRGELFIPLYCLLEKFPSFDGLMERVSQFSHPRIMSGILINYSNWETEFYFQLGGKSLLLGKHFISH